MVHVNPLNRYSPVFQSAKYESPLNEDVPVGSYVHTVRAVDKDEGINGKILYSIVAGNDLSWFAINQDTGGNSVFLNKTFKCLVHTWANAFDQIVNSASAQFVDFG